MHRPSGTIQSRILGVIELKRIDYLRTLRRYWILVLTSLLLGGLGGVAANAWMKPSYQSQTQLFMSIESSGTVQELQQVNTFLRQRAGSYVTAARTPRVLQKVIDDLNLQIRPSELQDKVTVEALPNTVVLSITANDESPDQAMAIARHIAESLILVVPELESSGASGAPELKLTLLTPGEVPTAPVSPNKLLNLVIGVLSGLAIGIGSAMALSKNDTKVRDEADLRRVTNLEILGAVALEGGGRGNHLLTDKSTRSPWAESFRQLRTHVLFAHSKNPSKAVVITSAVPGEGKTCAAINLGLSLAQAGQRVVVVDADLRRSKMGEYLGLKQNAGLTTAVAGRMPLDVLLQPYGGNGLSILTSGQLPPNPSELLASPAMVELLQQLEQTHDVVIIDTPPLLSVTDASVLAQRVGAVVLIVGSGEVKEADVQKALHYLSLVQAKVIGVVLNRTSPHGVDAPTYKYSLRGSRVWRKKHETNAATNDEAAADLLQAGVRESVQQGDGVRRTDDPASGSMALHQLSGEKSGGK